MLAVDTILVARDSSSASRRALRTGLLLATRMQATLHVLHVFEEQKEVYPTQDLDAVRRELVQSGHTTDQALESVSVHASERQGTDAGPTILHYAEEENVDLIALGTHGRSGVKRVFIGSVAERVIRRANRAVLTVQDREAEEERASLESIDRILVPVDFSRYALEATRVATEWAGLYGAQADLLHVTDQDRLRPGDGKSAGETDETNSEDRPSTSPSTATVRSQLVEFAKDGCRLDVPVNLHVESGDIGDAIVEFISRRGTDLVMMATRGRTAIQRLVLGSITETIVRHATCPVLTVRTTGQSIRATALGENDAE